VLHEPAHSDFSFNSYRQLFIQPNLDRRVLLEELEDEVDGREEHSSATATTPSAGHCAKLVVKKSLGDGYAVARPDSTVICEICWLLCEELRCFAALDCRTKNYAATRVEYRADSAKHFRGAKVVAPTLVKLPNVGRGAGGRHRPPK
jgi:hypothetical protein